MGGNISPPTLKFLPTLLEKGLGGNISPPTLKHSAKQFMKWLMLFGGKYFPPYIEAGANSSRKDLTATFGGKYFPPYIEVNYHAKRYAGEFGGKYFPPYIEALHASTLFAELRKVWGEIFPPLH